MGRRPPERNYVTTRRPTKLKRSRPTLHPRKKNVSGSHCYSNDTSRETTLEVREVTKLLRRDTTSSNDDFTSYRRSIKLIPTSSATHPVKNETPDPYPERATRSKIIHEGRPTTTKPTFVALPNLTSHSTFHECSKGTPCQPQASLHKHLTKPVVIISYPHTWKERSHHCRHPLLAGTPQRNPHRRSRFNQTQRSQRPSKLVSTLPAPLSNQRESYLLRIPRLRQNNLYRLVTRSRHFCTLRISRPK